MSDNTFGPVAKYGRSPENEIASVESLSQMHKIMHGVKTGSGYTPSKAEEFITGRTGEPAVDDMGFCNLCNKHTIAGDK
jgi:hypothetical protein